MRKEKSGSWDMGQNALDQSDCRSFKLTISPEHKDEKAWFFACWYRLMEIKSWLKKYLGGCGQKWVWLLWSKDTKIGCISKRKYGCGHLGLGTLKFAVSQDWICKFGWFFAYWYKFMKAKNYFNN